MAVETVPLDCSTRLEEWKQVASWSGAEKVRTQPVKKTPQLNLQKHRSVFIMGLRTGLFASSLTVLGGIIMLLARDVYILRYIKYHRLQW